MHSGILNATCMVVLIRSFFRTVLPGGLYIFPIILRRRIVGNIASFWYHTILRLVVGGPQKYMYSWIFASGQYER